VGGGRNGRFIAMPQLSLRLFYGWASSASQWPLFANHLAVFGVCVVELGVFARKFHAVLILLREVEDA